MFRIKPLQDFGIDEPARVVLYDIPADRFSLTREVQAGEDCCFSFDELEAHWNYKFKIQTLSDGQWVDRSTYAWLLPEAVTEEGLKYLFYPYKGSDKLVVVFQAVNRKPGYNYVKTLFGVPVNRLYLKDDYGGDAATRSSYYLGRDRSFDIADRVQRFLASFTESLSIRRSHCIFVGSSKGGYAALYHGYRFGAGHILPGGPQILLGDYLNVRSEKSIRYPMLPYLAGGRDEESVAWANRVLRDVLVSATAPFPQTEVHIGAREPHYHEHVAPFMEWVAQAQIPNVTLDLSDYSTHEELATHYPPFLRDRVARIIQGCLPERTT
jgi:accessory secretory protein Asp2